MSFSGLRTKLRLVSFPDFESLESLKQDKVQNKTVYVILQWPISNRKQTNREWYFTHAQVHVEHAYTHVCSKSVCASVSYAHSTIVLMSEKDPCQSEVKSKTNDDQPPLPRPSKRLKVNKDEVHCFVADGSSTRLGLKDVSLHPESTRTRKQDVEQCISKALQQST